MDSLTIQGQNRGASSLAVVAITDLNLSPHAALYASVNLELFATGTQFGYGGDLRWKF
ncbi:MAG: hypothetical protein NTZ53_00910 [Cyanobacteria bacterium]|nr:hypothetical protein [Cyanobacteriota bacterium]